MLLGLLHPFWYDSMFRLTLMEISPRIRLFLEGKRSDRLAIHLKHLLTLPSIIHLSNDHHSCLRNDQAVEQGYFEPVKWSIFSHVCTAPIKYISSGCCPIVTRAWFEVKSTGMKKGVLCLRLGFFMVAFAKKSEDSSGMDPPLSLRKSGLFLKLCMKGGKNER